MKLWDSTQKSIGGLIRQLADDAKTGFKKELELAKAELSEQVAKFGRHGVWLAGGVLLAYGGLMILLLGLGVFLAWLLIQAGIEEIFAIFAGLGMMAVLTLATGVSILLVSLKKLKALSLVPEKTVHEAKRFTADVTGRESSPPAQSQVPEVAKASEEVQADVRAMRHNIGDTIDELKDRLTFRSLANETVNQVKAHPMPIALIGAGTALVGFLVVRKARGRSHRRALAVERPLSKTDGMLGKLLAVVQALELLYRARSVFSAHGVHDKNSRAGNKHLPGGEVHEVTGGRHPN